MNQDPKKIDSLNILLADYQVLFQKVRHFHWNVKGNMFFELHRQFEKLYQEANHAADSIAERVIALGGSTIPTLKEQISKSRLEEIEEIQNSREMVKITHGDLQKLNHLLHETAQLAHETNDTATANLLESFADQQEKRLWMFRAFLEEDKI